MNNYTFRVDYLKNRHSNILGKKHPLVSLSKTMFSSMSNPSFYDLYNKEVAPTPDPDHLDPNLYENLDALLEKYGLNTPETNNIEDTLNKGYWEILYHDQYTKKWYDYASENMTIQNIDPANYDYESVAPFTVDKIVENGKRFTIYNQSYLIRAEVETNWPETKDIPFENNPDLYSPLTLIAKISSLNTQSYTVTEVDRTSCFVYQPAATCFLLVYSPPKHVGKLEIYCMQSWTNRDYTELDPVTNMCYLNTYLADPSNNVSTVLPKDWTFVQCILGNEAMIALFSNPSLGIRARVISDGIGNSYQYVRKEEAPFLYDIFEKKE